MRTNHHAVIVGAGLLATFLWCSPALADELTVTATAGKVTVIEHGHPVALSVGGKLSPPVEIRTGADGVVDVQQLGSRLHIGPNSTIALPEAASAGNAVDKIKQSAGYVLYNIKSRKDHPLSVETPYLVSVVKGTVFTIAVEEHAATVALMEGSLDISAPGVTEHVLLKPNQSIRHADGEPQLSVRSSASASAMPRGGLHGDAPNVLPDAMPAGQMVQVAKELADAGAAVSAGRTLATRLTAQSAGTGASGTNSSQGGTGSAGASSAGVSGSAGSSGQGGSISPASGGAAGSTDSSSSSASSGSAAAGGSTSTGGPSSTGSSSNTAGSTNTGSTVGTSGNAATGDSGSVSTAGSSTGSSATTSGTVALPSSGSGSSTSATGNCNGKNNGTGNGNCYGHTPGHNGKQ